MSSPYQGYAANITQFTSANVSGATNASPIVITTSAAHGFATGDYVSITGVLGNTAANGAFYITILSTTTFSLNGSTGTGAYTSGGTVSDYGLFPYSSLPSNGDAFSVDQMNAFLQNQADKVAYLGNATGYFFSAIDPSVNGTRLSLSSTAPVPATDVVGGTTLYLLVYRSGNLGLYDQPSGNWFVRSVSGSGTSLTLSGLTAGLNYDVYAYWTGSAVALELGSAWAGDNTPPTRAVIGGVIVRDATPTGRSRRYVGAIRATAATTTEDSASKRFVYNADNKVRRHLLVTDATASWTYASTTVRQVRGQTANKVEVMIGDVGPLDAFATGAGTSTAQSVRVIAGIGIDSTTVSSAMNFGDISSTNFASEINANRAELDTVLSAGYHAINWLESLNSATSTTVYGTAANGLTSSLRAHVSI